MPHHFLFYVYAVVSHTSHVKVPPGGILLLTMCGTCCATNMYERGRALRPPSLLRLHFLSFP